MFFAMAAIHVVRDLRKMWIGLLILSGAVYIEDMSWVCVCIAHSLGFQLMIVLQKDWIFLINSESLTHHFVVHK